MQRRKGRRVEGKDGRINRNKWRMRGNMGGNEKREKKKGRREGCKLEKWSKIRQKKGKEERSKGKQRTMKLKKLRRKIKRGIKRIVKRTERRRRKQERKRERRMYGNGKASEENSGGWEKEESNDT